METPDPLALVEPAASRVRDPVSGRSVWLSAMVRNARVDQNGGAVPRLIFDLVFSPDHGRDQRREIEQELVRRIGELGFDGEVIAMPRLRANEAKAPPPPKADPVPGMSGPGMGPHGGPVNKAPIPGVKRVIAVASGKGGVGKSTIATNLAVGLQRLGLRVGLMDADIYGPSLPVMMGVQDRPMVTADKKILPVMAHGVRCLSIGLLVDADQAMIWRGPMVMGVVRQFLQDADWTGGESDLDILVVDLPPGTGDAQLTLVQAVDLDGAVIVTTPQEVALADAVRGISMFRKLDVPLLGLVENMAYYPLPDGSRDYVFGRDGGKRTAERFGTVLLAEIPLQTRIREGGDTGRPIVVQDGALAESFVALARSVATELGLSLS